MSARIQKTRGPKKVADRRPPPIDSEEASLLYCDEVLAGDGTFLHIDRVDSVSGLVLVRGITPIPEWIQRHTRPEGDPHGS